MDDSILPKKNLPLEITSEFQCQMFVGKGHNQGDQKKIAKSL